MSASSFLAALASLALVLALATAQGPECKTGPHPTVLAVQQKCAKGSLLCKQVEVDIVAFNMDSPQTVRKVLYPSVISNLNHKETEYATVLSATDGTNAFFVFPITASLADPKPILVTASIAGAGVKVLPLDVVNATALVYLHTLGKLVLVTQDDIFTVDVTTGSLTPNHIPFPGPGYLNTGVATTDGANVFLLFGQDPTQVDVPNWFIAVIDVVEATVVQGLSHPPSKFPIAMHWNPLANGTMILNAMMWSPDGVAGIQVGTLNPYNCSDWSQMFEYDGNYFPDTEPISNLPEGTPSALSQQMSTVIGDYFYATLLVTPEKKLHAATDASQWNSVYINMRLGDVTTHLKPRPWSCYNPFPALSGAEQYTAFVWLAPSLRSSAPSSQLSAAPASRDNTCGGNCPNGCSDCPCGSTPAIVDAGHWCNEGVSSGWEEDSCTCIVQASSGSNGALSSQNTDGAFSLGMFQTYAPANSTFGCDPNDSLKAAMAAFEAGGKTWKLWSTCVGCGVCAGP